MLRGIDSDCGRPRSISTFGRAALREALAAACAAAMDAALPVKLLTEWVEELDGFALAV